MFQESINLTRDTGSFCQSTAWTLSLYFVNNIVKQAITKFSLEHMALVIRRPRTKDHEQSLTHSMSAGFAAVVQQSHVCQPIAVINMTSTL